MVEAIHALGKVASESLSNLPTKDMDEKELTKIFHDPKFDLLAILTAFRGIIPSDDDEIVSDSQISQFVFCKELKGLKERYEE